MITQPVVGMKVVSTKGINCCGGLSVNERGIITEIESLDSFVVTIQKGKHAGKGRYHCRECVREVKVM